MGSSTKTAISTAEISSNKTDLPLWQNGVYWQPDSQCLKYF
jgi:hypothetical protein